MRRRTSAEWHQLFAEFETSGETAAGFCEARGLSRSYFQKRRRQLAGSPTFVPVRVSSSRARIVICIGEVSIRCEPDVPVSWLRELVSALRP